MRILDPIGLHRIRIQESQCGCRFSPYCEPCVRRKDKEQYRLICFVTVYTVQQDLAVQNAKHVPE